MANHPSAEKRNRQRIVRTERNKAVRSALRTTLKKARLALASGDAGDAATNAKETVHAAVKALARAAKKGVIHPRTASRKTSRLQSAATKSAGSS